MDVDQRLRDDADGTPTRQLQEFKFFMAKLESLAAWLDAMLCELPKIAGMSLIEWSKD